MRATVPSWFGGLVAGATTTLRADEPPQVNATGSLINPFGGGEMITASNAVSLGQNRAMHVRIAKPRVLGREVGMLLEGRVDTVDHQRRSR
jgi:hypothetical protein